MNSSVVRIAYKRFLEHGEGGTKSDLIRVLIKEMGQEMPRKIRQAGGKADLRVVVVLDRVGHDETNSRCLH